MPKPRLIDRPRELTLSLPSGLLDKVDAYLRSDRSGKVPYGGRARFFTERVEEFFRRLETNGNSLLKEIENESRNDVEDQPSAGENGPAGRGDNR